MQSQACVLPIAFSPSSVECFIPIEILRALRINPPSKAILSLQSSTMHGPWKIGVIRIAQELLQ